MRSGDSILVLAAAAAALPAAGCIYGGLIQPPGKNIAETRDAYVRSGYVCTPYGRTQILCDRRTCTSCPQRSAPLVLITYDPTSFEVTKIE